jgi:DNA-directed RNA polymerase specialized sigma24 family protein
MLDARKTTIRKRSPYATSADFTQIFETDMNRLYQLSFLLTGDRALAEKCFVRGLDNSAKDNPIFREWAENWARRTVIRSAIQMIRPRPTGDQSPSAPHLAISHAGTEPAEMARIVELPPFERFAFVMSVLEHLSDRECSLLLDCTRGEVLAARIRALQQIGRATELHKDPKLALQWEAYSHLPASA